MTVKTVGLDLAKDVFQVHGISENGRVIFNKAIKRAKPFRLATTAMANKAARIIWAMLTKKQEYRQPAF